MQDMSQFGRNGDTMMAHVSPGEAIVPQEILTENPKLAKGLGVAFEDAGLDPSRYVVGSGTNSINPDTGEPEFFLDKILEFGSKVLGGGGGSSFLSNPMVQGALANMTVSALQGKKVSPKDALVGAALGSGLGMLTGRGSGFGGEDPLGQLLGKLTKAPVATEAAKEAATNAVQDQVKDQVVKSAYKEGLLGYGDLLGIDVESPLGRILNSQAGEALATGLGAKVYDMLFPAEEPDPDPYGMIARFNRGAGQGPVKFAPRGNQSLVKISEKDIKYAADGGPMYFPRRNGGIMPEEGSGTKDDVPAMLMAGEFVMTRDAVKGAGDGDLKKGIKKMYGVMDKLEDMA